MTSTEATSIRLITVEMTRPDSEAYPESIRSLTEAIANGDDRQFQVFYDLYAKRLWRFLLIVTAGDEDTSRELQQIVLLKAARKMRRFDAPGQLWAWLSEIARNSWRDCLRRKMREQKFAAALTDRPPDTGSACDEIRLFELLESELDQLSASEQALIRNFYFDKLSQKEIAEQSGRTNKAIESELARVRKKLKQFLLKRLKNESPQT